MAVAAVGGGGATQNFVMQMAGNLHPFLFVGCWNRVGEPRDTVIKAMLATAEEKGIQNIVLGGDNVYPLPEDDKKLKEYKKFKKEKKEGEKWDKEIPVKHRVETFMEGIAPFAGKTVILALGNHNVEDPPVLMAEMARLPFDKTYYAAEFEDAAVVVFDANIKNSDGDLFDKMKDWLTSLLLNLKAKGKPYYFVTHEPFGSFKKGSRTIWGIDKERIEDAAIVAAGSTPVILFTLQTHPPIAVLCADTHHYEVGTIHGGKHDIPQYIVGSGGADYNTYTEPRPPFGIGCVFTYSMTSEPVSKYGFLLLEDAASTTFIPALNWAGGRRRNTRRRGSRAHKKLTRRAPRRL